MSDKDKVEAVRELLDATVPNQGYTPCWKYQSIPRDLVSVLIDEIDCLEVAEKILRRLAAAYEDGTDDVYSIGKAAVAYFEGGGE